jgi:redox-sensing transcriptional repressor
MSSYHRRLAEMEQERMRTVSSDLLAERNGVSPAQVRKDLSCFGNFGKRGWGYDVQELRARIRHILGLDHQWNTCLVGAGNLGQALFRYKEFRKQGFNIVAVFDNDPHKIGRTWGDVRIARLVDLKKTVCDSKVEIGVVAVPAASAQEVVDTLVACGVRGVLNFAPRQIKVSPGVVLRNVDLTMALEWITYSFTRK